MRANLSLHSLRQKVQQANLRRSSIFMSCLALSLLLVGSGCRTYGARGDVEAAYNQIEQAVEQFTLELERAQSSYEALRQQEDGSEVVDTLPARYASLLKQHKVILLEQRMQLEELRDSDDYRAVSRTLGAVISEQDIMMDHYQALLASVGDATDEAVDQAHQESPYFITPPFYGSFRPENLQAGNPPAGAGVAAFDSAGASSTAPGSGATPQP